jgi:hypothetical protein
MTRAITINKAIQAYITILPHQPFPSDIRLNNPILRCAASNPNSFLSSPLVAESRTVFSDSREEEKACEEALRADAMLRREEVRDSCSVRLCVRRASVVAVEMPVLVAAGVRSSARRADVVGFLARSSVVVVVVGVIVDWGGGGWDICGE